MVNVLINALARCLYDKFNITVIIDSQEQEFDVPCFYISVVSHDEERELDNRYKANSNLSITYINEDRNGKADLYDVISKLDDLLNIIDTERGKFYCFNKKANIIDNDLNYLVTFKYRLIRDKEKVENMENLDLKGVIRSG